MNLAETLRRGYRAQLPQAALVPVDGATWTYGHLERAASQIANLLVDCGVEPGDRVVVQVDKSPEAVALYLGTLRCGAVYVPLNTAYTPDEVEYFLGDAEARVLVARQEALAALSPGAARCGVGQVFELGSGEPASMEATWTAFSGECAIVDRSDEELAAIVYTSGTTGRSKGAMLSHGSLASNALALHRLWGFEPGDVLLHALPIFHVHGLFVALHTAFLNASRILFVPSFDAATVRALLRQATVLMGVPTFYVRLLQESGFGRQDCRGVRLFVSGSAPLTEATFHEFEERTGHRILERYGMSEAGMITSNPLHGERVAGTVGYPLPGVEVRVADEDGSVLSTGEVGVLEIQGPNLFSGYWRQPDKTAEEHRSDGFFITGDMARVDADGRVSIVGRSKDLIIAGGYNIYPKEVEMVLDALEGVAESAVVGVPHADLGEGVVAVLVASSGSPLADEELRATLDAKLARFKHPRCFYWLDELPRNAMGKVQKNELRERFGSAFDGT